MSVTIADLNNLQPKSQNLSSLMKAFALNFSYNLVIPALKSNAPDFTLITKNHKYQLHLEIVAAVSEVVFLALTENPELAEYTYNGDDSDFDQIAAFLNGDIIEITNDNRNYIKTVAEDLKFTISITSELSIKRLARRFYAVLPYVPKKAAIVSEKATFHVNKLISYTLCRSFDAKTNSVHISSSLSELSEIADYLNGETLTITYDNFANIKKILDELQVTSLSDVLGAISRNYAISYPLLTIINLQDTLVGINDRNVESIYSLIVDSDFFKNSELHHDLIKALEVAFVVRPRYFKSVIELILMFSKESAEFNQSLIKYIKITSSSGTMSVPMIRQLFDAKLIDYTFIKELVDSKHFDRFGYDYSFNSIFESFKNKIRNFFAAELKVNNPEMYDRFFVDSKRSDYYITPPRPNDILKFEENAWVDFYRAVSLGHRPDDITTAIFNDDIDALQSISSAQPDFDFNKAYGDFVLEPNNAIIGDRQNSISYAKLAAFYGSVQCFKFLMLQNADLTDCPKFAIAGGNYEIIRLLEQKGCSFKNMFASAVKYHQYDIYKWLTVNHGPIDNFYKSEGGPIDFNALVPLSIQSFNQRAFLGFFDYGIDHGKQSELQLVGVATQYFNLHALKLLLKTIGVNTSAIHLKTEASPLFHAASFNYLEFVKALVEEGKSKLFENSSCNPLKEATKRGNIEVIKFLAPLYKEFISDDYLKSAKNDEIKAILIAAKNS